MKPMKQMWVSASTPPASAVGVTPARIRSAPSAMDAAPEAHAITTVSLGPVRRRRALRVSAWERGRIERRDRMFPVACPRHSPQYQFSPSSMPPPTAPTSSADSRRARPSSPESARASRAAASARRSARERRRETRRAGRISAGTSAAMRERKPSVSMRVMGLMAQVPAARPVQKLLTPAPYGLTTPSPLTTTSGRPPGGEPPGDRLMTT